MEESYKKSLSKLSQTTKELTLEIEARKKELEHELATKEKIIIAASVVGGLLIIGTITYIAIKETSNTDNPNIIIMNE